MPSNVWGTAPAAVKSAPQKPGLPRRRRRQAGVTLIEVAVVVSLTGILLAIFVPVFFRELTTSKTAEAGRELKALHLQTAAYYQRRIPGAGGPPLRRCLPSSTGPAPTEASSGPVAINFADPTTPGFEVWSDLGYQPASRIRYRYSIRGQGGCSLSGETARVTLRAEGDLDDDGKHSVFERVSVANEDFELTPRGALFVLDRAE